VRQERVLRGQWLRALATAWIAPAIFALIETFHMTVRRHSGLGYLSPIEFEDLHTAASAAA